MRTLLLAALFVLASCGSDPAAPCAGSHNGSWSRGDGDIFTFVSDCSLTYSGTNALPCTATGTYDAALSSGGDVVLTFTSVTGGACVDLGSLSCGYNFSGDLLVLDCGATVGTYGRQ